MGVAECTMMSSSEGANLNPWPIPDYLRMEQKSILFFGGGGKGPEDGQ
jgi:hypothetical protein